MRIPPAWSRRPNATHTQRGPFSQQALLDRRLHVPSIQYVGLIFLQSWLLASVACLEPAQRRRSKLVFPTERDIGALAGFMARASFLMQPTAEKGSAIQGGLRGPEEGKGVPNRCSAKKIALVSSAKKDLWNFLLLLRPWRLFSGLNPGLL